MPKVDPRNLIEQIKTGQLDDADLSFAYEELGKVQTSIEVFDPLVARLDQEVIDLLIVGLEHKNPIVREGVIYGLSNFGNDKRVQMTLAACSGNDPNKIIRTIAKEVFVEIALAQKGQDDIF